MKSYQLYVTYQGHELHKGSSLDAQYYAENTDDTLVEFADETWTPISAEIVDEDGNEDQWLGINSTPQPPAEWASKQDHKCLLVQAPAFFEFDLEDDHKFDWTNFKFSNAVTVHYLDEELELFDCEMHMYESVWGAEQ